MRPAGRLAMVVAVGASLQGSCSRPPDRGGPVGVVESALVPVITGDPDPPPPPPVLDGGVVTSCYPQAVELLLGGDQHACSGVVIDSQAGRGTSLVLTSAHCIALGGTFAPVAKVRTGTETTSTITAIYVNPSFNDCQPGGTAFANASGRDLAVVQVPADLATPPARLASASELPANGGPLDVVGFGDPNPGQRRLGAFHRDDSVVGAAAAAAGALGMDGDNAGTCPGDSGGPVFTHTAGCGATCPGACSGNPAPVVVGVNSSQPLGVPRGVCSLPQSVAASTTDADNLAWLNSVKQGTAAPYNPQLNPGTNQLAKCCTTGQTVACTGDGGCTGTKQCKDDGTFEPCQCTCANCTSLGKTCGTWPDGCGGSLSCGDCNPGFTCNSQGQCECVSASVPPECGPWTDKCGAPRDAGPCPGGQVCTNNVCCTPQTCGSLGKTCDPWPDGCGGTVFCGGCDPPFHCNDQGSCACGGGCMEPLCGQDDGCGRSCSNADDVCNGCGTTNRCGRYCGDCCDWYDCDGICNGSATVDCAGICGGGATPDACGVCAGDGSECGDGCDGEGCIIDG